MLCDLENDIEIFNKLFPDFWHKIKDLNEKSEARFLPIVSEE